VACALKETNPRIRVIGVEPEKLPSMLRAREAGHPVTISAEATIADGIAVRRAGDLTLPLVSRYVDEIVTVDDEEIASAILLLLEQEKTLAEGAGRRGAGCCGAVEDQPAPSPHGGAGVRRQHRRDPAGQDH
jgi:threonine dehydratase